MSKDPHLGTCVICGQETSSKEYPDFCEECIENEEPASNMGRCYVCRDYSDHENCIGPPCQCPCPPPDQAKKQAAREAVLAKLTPHERQILGF